MEKFYFIEKNGSKIGPLKFDDLKSHTIYSDDLVWRSDNENWKKALDFEELDGIFIIKPPPTPKEIETLENNTNLSNKKTGNISDQITFSVIGGFSLSLLIVVFSHVFPRDWRAMPYSEGNNFVTLSDKVRLCGYECMLGERHSANCNGLTISDVNEKSLSADELFSASFEHFFTMIIVGLVLSTIIYLFKRVTN